MKKLILAITFVFLLFSCGPTEKEKYEELFDDDNPLIGTWENERGEEQIVFIDDTTMYFTSPVFDDDPTYGTIYTYEFDQTPIYVMYSLFNLYDEPAMRIKIFIHDYHESIFEADYLTNKKILFYHAEPYKKIKK